MTYNDANSQKAAMSIQHFLPLKHLPSPQSTWETVIQTMGIPTSHHFLIAQHNPCQSPSLWSSHKAKKKRVETFTPIAWTEIYKNLNQHYTIYIESFMQLLPLFYLPGLLGWMANMEENTLLSWCFAFCKIRIFVLPALVPNWTTIAKVSLWEVSNCTAIILEKTLLCYFAFSRKFLMFVQYWPAFKYYQTRLS